MVYTPSMNARLSNPRYPTIKRKELEVAAAANPHILRIRVARRPNGLKQWSEPSPGSPGQARGLAAPNIVKIGHVVPKIKFMGRRRHFPGKLCVIIC
jgi:hypothetical protein